VRIEELEDILSFYRFLPKPRNVVLVGETVTGRVNQRQLRLRGLKPADKKDTIVLTPDATPNTVLHEILHMLGLRNELITQLLGNLLTRKYRFVKARPVLSSFLRRDLKYRLCEECREFSKLHQVDGRLQHYVFSWQRTLFQKWLIRRRLKKFSVSAIGANSSEEKD